MTKLYTKKKFEYFFDLVVLSVHSANYMQDPKFNYLFKDRTMVHVESADYIIAFKPEHKEAYRGKIREYADRLLWKSVAPGATPYQHHMLYEVHKPEGPPAASATNDDDLYNLDGL